MIGSGPNGFAAAITLAQNGYRVRIVEAADLVGGGIRSSELTLPGFRHDCASAIHPLAVGSPFFRDLPLHRYRLEWIQPEIALAHPFDDGTAAVLHPSLDRTCAGLGAEDGEAYRRMVEPLASSWEAFSDEILRPMLHLPRHPALAMHFARHAIQSATRLIGENFRGESARALFAGVAAHACNPLDAPLSASFGLVLCAAAHSVGWPLPKGGAQSIASALARYLLELGGEIETRKRVDDLSDLVRTRVVLCDLSAWDFARVGRSVLPKRYRRRLEKFRHAPAVFKVDYALRGRIPWRNAECGLAGTVHLAGSYREVVCSERQVASGEIPERPMVLLSQPSLFDGTRAPEGMHTAWAYCHIPFGCSIDMTSRIEAQIERFAPGFSSLILKRCSSGPGVLEKQNPNFAGGDISGGATDWWQLVARPTLGFSPYRTPVPGLYLCSSSTPPGPGVHGMCGHLAAKTALRREMRAE